MTFAPSLILMRNPPRAPCCRFAAALRATAYRGVRRGSTGSCQRRRRRRRGGGGTKRPSSFLSAAPVETEAGLGLQRRTRRTSEQLLSAVACRVFWECLRLTHQLFDCSLRSATTITALAHSRSCAPQSRDPRRSCRPGCAARADCCVEPEASPRRAGSRRVWLASWSWRHQKARQHAFSAVWAAASLWQRRWSAPAASA